jgi:phenylpropionate dioxygenase-like ring-hydroxylating dioxygenase large terminal subunit
MGARVIAVDILPERCGLAREFGAAEVINANEVDMAETTFAPFVRNAWYLAAWPEELAEGMLSRTIMNEPLVLFRDASGTVGALEDRCCHRGAPLTHGAVVAEGIQCGYHGLIFDCTGTCVKVPGQDTVPRKAVVRSYPIVERQQCLWILTSARILTKTIAFKVDQSVSKAHFSIDALSEKKAHLGYRGCFQH